MGLAISQVRLLALTNRKADIECQMQIDSKRKQMLTRKSTELAQIYYQKLQCNHIQYPTGNGYEDVDYDFLMGKQAAYHYDSDFIQQITTGSGDIAQKATGKMVLTNQYGQVLINDDLAKFIQMAHDDYPAQSVRTQTAQALANLVQEFGAKKNSKAAQALFHLFEKSNTGEYDTGMRDKIVQYIEAMLKNGGYQHGGTLYENGGNYYYTLEEATSGSPVNAVQPQEGYSYSVRDTSNAITSKSGVYLNGAFCGGTNVLTDTMAAYLGNLVNYFAPMISAALQNNFKTDPTTGDEYQSPSTTVVTPHLPGSAGSMFKDATGAVINLADGTLTQAQIESRLNVIDANNSGATVAAGVDIAVKDSSNVMHYYRVWADASNTIHWSAKVESDYNEYEVTDHSQLEKAMVTENLQTGLRSGMYQLAMVEDIARGVLHKNTTLEYFTHMNYVVEKADSSEREEITAWFNKEQALISEKETYWDSEIQNLSTELNSVNTEIDSVKSLKSNAIKSVFNWGGS